MGFSTIDYIVVLIYLAGITVFGMQFKTSQRSVKDYFVGARNTSWIVICLSIVAILLINNAWFMLVYYAGRPFGPTVLTPPAH